VGALFFYKTVISPPICEVAFSKVTQMQTMMIELIPVSKLRPYAKNARNHSKKQIRQIADSIKAFGFTNPVLIGDDNEIIAGHGRVDAARLLQMDSVLPYVYRISMPRSVEPM
jgi:ParB-like chromosome segregation protein Spo0J